MVLRPGLEGCVSTKFFERLDLCPWDYSTIHVISEIITQASLKIKNWYFFSSSLFGIWDIYGPKPPKMTGQYPSQKNMHSHITLNVRSVLVSWRVLAPFFCRVRWQAFICYPIFIVKQNTHIERSRSCVPLIGNRFRYPNSQVMRLISQYIKSKEVTFATNFFS